MENTKLTLNVVLQALAKKDIGFFNNKLITVEDIGYCRDEVTTLCDWDLEKETLELQTKKTQKIVNNLLTH